MVTEESREEGWRRRGQQKGGHEQYGNRCRRERRGTRKKEVRDDHREGRRKKKRKMEERKERLRERQKNEETQM